MLDKRSLKYVYGMKLNYNNVGGISFMIVIMHLINMEFILGNDVTTMVEELLNKKCGDIIA
jgi:hypothetical protein